MFLFYGLAWAFVLRFGSLYIISFIVDVWQVQVIGVIYLLFISIKHLYDKATNHPSNKKLKEGGSGFWMTVVKIEFADMAFAVVSIFSAFSLAVLFTHSWFFNICSLGMELIIFIFSSVIIE